MHMHVSLVFIVGLLSVMVMTWCVGETSADEDGPLGGLLDLAESMAKKTVTRNWLIRFEPKHQQVQSMYQ